MKKSAFIVTFIVTSAFCLGTFAQLPGSKLVVSVKQTISNKSFNTKATAIPTINPKNNPFPNLTASDKVPNHIIVRTNLIARSIMNNMDEIISLLLFQKIPIPNLQFYKVNNQGFKFPNNVEPSQINFNNVNSNFIKTK